MKKIKDLRLKINDIDKKILDLVIQRLQVVEEIGDIKREYGVGVIDTNREMEVLSRLIKEAENRGASPDVVKKVWKVLMEISYEIEEKNGNS